MTERFNTFRPDGEATADRWAGALHLFDRTDQAGRADPTEETPADRWERAGLMFEERRYIEAARLLAGLVEEFPRHTAARLLLARAYYHSAQLNRAEKQLRTLIEHDPVEPYAHLLLGRVLERQNRPDEARTWLRRADAFTADA
ncbi:tetratricopeptide repeat protein [Actinopolymorpha singaporensis]|uniref:Tetratricopeptide repeat-containing protein n=1 Tax=Actinopolymorpha singaporensis TaxID=117157 RepID=A0A1H1LVH2_9ACTN|nr:tetratricopeptide repeat protein [Actinopolymorpha singaporensis]SDR78417.1 Tetratricopeptide repeat-containing protein [Actinopolymorpha singaporensis]